MVQLIGSEIRKGRRLGNPIVRSINPSLGLTIGRYRALADHLLGPASPASPVCHHLPYATVRFRSRCRPVVCELVLSDSLLYEFA